MGEIVGFTFMGAELLPKSSSKKELFQDKKRQELDKTQKKIDTLLKKWKWELSDFNGEY